MNSNSQTPTADSLITAHVGDDDHYLRHVTDQNSTFSVRHARVIKTRVEDGQLVHSVIEGTAEDAHARSLSWTRAHYSSCDACGADVETEADEDDDQYVQTWDCDECAWQVRRGSTHAPMPGNEKAKPLWVRVTYPHDFEDDVDADFEKAQEQGDGKMTTEEVANLFRDMYLTLRARALGNFNDAAHVSAEFDDDYNKTAEAYIDRSECGHCGDEVDTPAVSSHAHFGDVCPACEDVTVWSVEDAELPEDVAAKMDDHKTFSQKNIVALLRDTLYWGNYISAVQDARGDEDVSDPEDIGPIKTGKQGRRDMGRGGGYPGTGFRRPSGFAHNNRYFRTVLRDALETGLVSRVDGRDSDVDDEEARWKATEKGEAVFAELARCETCGGHKKPLLRQSSYRVGRKSQKSNSLTLACVDCDNLRSEPDGPLVLESSGSDWQLSEIPGVSYE